LKFDASFCQLPFSSGSTQYELKEKFRQNLRFDQPTPHRSLPVSLFKKEVQGPHGPKPSCVLFDFSAWYHQIKIGEEVLPHDIILTRAPILCNGVPSSHYSPHSTTDGISTLDAGRATHHHRDPQHRPLFSQEQRSYEHLLCFWNAAKKKNGATLYADELSRNREAIIAQGTVNPITFLGRGI
jgi:hypothetical protein